MKFRAEQYIEAASERVADARLLHNAGRYPAAIYFSGVAVESLLHGYCLKQNGGFAARHDLLGLVKESGIAGFITPRNRRKLGADLGDLWMRWKNNYRYASDSRLRAEFKRQKIGLRFKGDYLRENSRIALNCALGIVGIGAATWRT